MEVPVNDNEINHPSVKPITIVGNYMNQHLKQKLKEKQKKRKLNDDLQIDVYTQTRQRDALMSAIVRYDVQYMPRILKSDLRRQYPIMFMNAFNSGDYQYLKKWMQTFAVGDAKTSVAIPARHDPLCKFSQGIEAGAAAFYSFIAAAPDQASVLSSVQIKVRSDGTATAIAQHEVSGTIVVYLDPRKIAKLLPSCDRKSTPEGVEYVMLPRLPTPPFLIQLAKQMAVMYKQNPGALQILMTMLPNSPDKELLYQYICSLVHCILKVESITSNRYTSNTGAHQVCHSMNSTSSSPISASTSASSSQSPSSQLDYQKLPLFFISEEENDYLFSWMDDIVLRMIDGRELPQRSDQEFLAVGYPFTYCGDLQLHLDQDSRVHLNRWTIFMRFLPFEI